MRRIPTIPAITLGAATLAILGGVAFAAQDKYTVQVPGGIAFSEVRGYEKWQLVSVSQMEGELKAIMANPAAVKAYLAGAPGNGKALPDGAMIAKIRWKFTKNPESPFPVNVPDGLIASDFMVKDSKRFAATGGWGYASFPYNAASDTFTALGKGAGCGFSCHTKVAAKDYVFTAFQKR